MARSHKRHAKPAALNLVSLMDIFTIMVFFLMMNQSDVEVLSSDDIQLPSSQAQSKPKNTINLLVSQDEIVVQGRAIVSLDALKKVGSGEDIILSLKKELDYQASRSAPSLVEQELGRAITIMGDQGIPYRILKRILATCQSSKYTQISLAVQKREKQEA